MAPSHRLIAAVAVAIAGSTLFAAGPASAADPQPPTATFGSGTDTSTEPGPARGAPTIARRAQVANSGKRLRAAPRTSARAADVTRLAATGALAKPAAPPNTGGWITSSAWNIMPTAGQAYPAMPDLARDVVLPAKPVSATLTMAGVGLYVPRVNGRPVSTAVLQPGYSDPAKSVEYRSYDVTGLVDSGANRLSVQLGAGVYDEVSLPGRYSKLTHIGGPLALTARLDVTLPDGSTTMFDTSSGPSGAGWVARAGGTTVADWYGGEDHDAGKDDSSWLLPTTPLTAAAGWSAAVVANVSPSVKLYPQTSPPVVSHQLVQAKSVTRLSTGDWVVDYGGYVTGQPQLSITAARGTVVRMYPAERLTSAGVPDQSTATGNSSRPIYDQFTTAGAGGPETWHPQFVYHGFRYLRVTGLTGKDQTLSAAQFSAIPVMADLSRTGAFTTSDADVMAIKALTDTAIDANLQSIPTDCPDREKLGWMEENYLLFGALSERYDLSAYGQNMVRVMLEAQRADGSMPEIAPETVTFHAPFDSDVNWGAALVMVPWNLYRTYGDQQTLATAYDAMGRYTASVQRRSSGNLIDFGLGDWITPAKGARRGATVSMGYYSVVSTMARIAATLGKTSDAQTYTSLAASIKTAINGAYLHDGVYGSEQATNAMALVLGLAPNPTLVRGQLISLIAAYGGHVNTGEIGLGNVIQALSDMGRDDLVYQLIMQKSPPGFGYFAASGAPALPEYWTGMSGNGSLAHFMLGYPNQWAFEHLAGISQQADSAGFRKLLIRPAVYAGPSSASASMPTPQGTVSVSWTRTSDTAEVTVTVPAGAQASVVLPNGTTSVGPGTTTLTTQMGVRPTYGAVPFNIPTGTATKVPWDAHIWAVVAGKQAPISFAQWQSMGFPAPKTQLPPGSVVAHAIVGTLLYAWRPDGSVHALTYAEWQPLGKPAPVQLARSVNKYTWSTSVWLTTKWTAAPATWAVSHLTYADWVSLKKPRPVDNQVVTGSVVFRHAGQTALYLTDPGGVTHHLTGAEWTHLGRPTPKTVA